MIITTPAQKEKSSFHAETAYASKIPYSTLINDETIETKSGHLLQTIKLDGLFSETLDDELIDHEKHIRNTLLISLADSSTSLYIHTIRRKEKRLLTGIYQHEFAKQLHEKSQDHLAKKPFFINDHYITVIKKPPVGKIRRLTDIVRTLSNKIDENARTQYREEMLKNLDKITQRMITTLAHYGAKKLSINFSQTGRPISELLSFLSQLINLSERDITPPYADLSQYLPYKRIFFDKTTGTLALRDIHNKSIYASLLSLKDYTGHTTSGFLDGLLDVPAEMIITQSFNFLDKNDARGKIQKQARDQAQSDDGETTENLKINQTLDELGSGTAVTGEHHLSILCQGHSLAELDSAISAIDAALNQVGLIAVREDQGLKAAFFASLPANHAYIIRRAPIHSKNMACFTSLHNYSSGQFSGNHWGEAITVLETISGTPFYFNFHVLDVANTILIGPQGSGKTLCESFLLTLSMKYGGRLIILDIDESLKAFVLAMEGVYSNLSVKQHSGFAPFQMEDTAENRHFLVNLLRKIATLNGQSLRDEEDLQLKAVVDGAYQLPKAQRILRNIVPFMGMRQSGSLRMRFENWVNEGDYAWVFDNDIDTLSLECDALGFDMTAILNDPIARVPVYYYLFHRLDQLLDGTRTRIVTVEGWRALQDEMLQNKIREWSSTPRKKEAFLIMDTQSPEDISASPIGCKIIQESATQIYFSNPKGRYEDYVQHFGLTPKEFNIVKTLDKASRYFLLKQGKHSAVVRLDLKDFKKEMSILSWRVKNKKQLDIDRIIHHAGKKTSDWLPVFYQEIAKLNGDHDEK